jgi:putative sterol carrier protein
MVSAGEGRAAAYVISAPYSRWKHVLAGELDPVKGMMQGKLKLDGDLPTIIRYVRAANELVRLTTSVPTEYVDDRPAGAR